VRNPFTALFERRSVASSADLLRLLMGGSRSVAGVTVNEASALNVAAVLTGVEIRAELFSTLPLDVIEKTPGKRGSTELPDHWAAKVLSQPNSWQTRTEFLGMLETHRLLRGNGYAWKNLVRGRNGLQVVECVPMHPDRVEVIDPKVPCDPTEYKLQRSCGAPVDIPAIEMLHVKGLSTDGRRGRSFLQDMREVIGGAIATQDHANSLWSRDATPSVVLKHPLELGKEGRQRLEESWEATYGQGKDKRRVAVLEEGMTIERLSLTPNDGQFLETSQDLRAQIAAKLRVPPFMMGLSEKSTSWGSGIEQQQIGLSVFTLTPTTVTWEQRLHLDLLHGSPNVFVKFNVRATQRGDMRAQFESFWRGIQMGVYSPNDVRALLDLNPIAKGDIYLQPVNMGPLGLDPMAAAKGNTE
jgi:HK97 family phage portal protein